MYAWGLYKRCVPHQDREKERKEKSRAVAEAKRRLMEALKRLVVNYRIAMWL